jgi:hypothetical protein
MGSKTGGDIQVSSSVYALQIAINAVSEFRSAPWQGAQEARYTSTPFSRSYDSRQLLDHESHEGCDAMSCSLDVIPAGKPGSRAKTGKMIASLALSG